MEKRFALLAVIVFLSYQSATSQNHTRVINAAKPGAQVQPNMWGVFFEDINLGADGGIYTEMLKNRSFDLFKSLMGWTVNCKQFVQGAVLVLNRQEENSRNPRYL